MLKESIAIPLAVKLSPFYSSLPHLAAQLDRIGADGLVLFNRFYQPDIDPEALDDRARAALVGLVRAAAAAALAGHPVRPAARRRWPSAAACTSRSMPSRRSWPAPTACRWCRRCSRRGPAELRRIIAVPRGPTSTSTSRSPDARQHEPARCPDPRRSSAATIDPSPSPRIAGNRAPEAPVPLRQDPPEILARSVLDRRPMTPLTFSDAAAQRSTMAAHWPRTFGASLTRAARHREHLLRPMPRDPYALKAATARHLGPVTDDDRARCTRATLETSDNRPRRS